MAHTETFDSLRNVPARTTAQTIRRPLARRADGVVGLRELVRLGTLAASSHNTQPWRFRIVDDSTIEVRPDVSRRCPVVDPDDAHLVQSLGCAVENIVQAASVHGIRVDVQVERDERLIRLALRSDADVPESRLAPAIIDRRCTRGRFDGRPVDPEVIRALEAAAVGDGVRAIVLTDPGRVRMAAQFVERGNSDQRADPAFRRELIEWVRPNARAAHATRDGLWTRATGAPSIPSPCANWVLGLALRSNSQIRRETEAVESSAGLAVIVSRDDDLEAWVEAGRSVERLLLAATTAGLRTAFVNQPIEVSWLRTEFERWLGLSGERAQLMVRFGNGPTTPFSLRRPVDDVLDDDRDVGAVDDRPPRSTSGPRRDPVVASSAERMPEGGPHSPSTTADAPTPDAERPLVDEEMGDDLADVQVPFEAPVADVLDQHREVPLGVDDDRSR